MTVSTKTVLIIHADKGERGEWAIMLVRFGHYFNGYGFKLDRLVNFDYK